ncbi:MAG: hypothetical protein H0V19_02095, partial [Euzebyales bacterium]|nr:hypothetical protein [Euzebyales bacterium]
MSDSAPGRGEVDELFDDLLAHLVDVSPTTATQLGDHRRDAELDDWGPAEADRRLRTLGELRRRLDGLDVLAPEGSRRGSAGPGHRGSAGPGDDGEAAGDALLIADAVDGMRFELEGLRVHASDPLYYLELATSSVYDLIRRDDLAPEPRA